MNYKILSLPLAAMALGFSLFSACMFKDDAPSSKETAATSAAQSQPAAAPAPLPNIPSANTTFPARPNTPQVNFILIGPKLGNLEPCGCSGGQTGGMGRLRSKLEALVQADPGIVVIDAGELVKSHHPQAMLQIGAEAAATVAKMEETRGMIASSIYQQLPVSVVALGPNDFESGIENAKIRALLMSGMNDVVKYPTILRANVATNATLEEPITSSALVSAKNAGGVQYTILVMSLVDAEGGNFKNPAAAARAELQKQSGKYQFCVAVFHGVRARARDYAAAFPEVDLWLAAQGNGSPDERPEATGNALLVYAGEKSKNIIKFAGSRKDNKFIAENYEVMVVGAQDPNETGTQALIDSYRVKLGEDEIVKNLAGKRPAPKTLGGYAGSDACQTCHPTAYKIWKESKHSHALESLAVRNGQNDPECIQCHVTGWMSEPPVGEKTGYKGDGMKGKFGYVSCESCHGPALKHTQGPLLAKPVRNIDCRLCHDPENSPNFDRDKYWPKIEHHKEK